MVIDGNRPFAEDEGGKEPGAEASYEMVESLKHFINEHSVKALMSTSFGPGQ